MKYPGGSTVISLITGSKIRVRERGAAIMEAEVGMMLWRLLKGLGSKECRCSLKPGKDK